MAERNNPQELDEIYMRQALELASSAAARGEVPVGAIVICNEVGSDGQTEGLAEAPPRGRVVARSGNLKESEADPLGHAEIRVLREAARELGRWRLTGCTLYVTLEPCVMCAGAIVHSRVDRVVYGASDPKAGAVESLYEILKDSRLNHQPAVTSGILADECAEVLSSFFSERRTTKREEKLHAQRTNQKPSTS